MSDIEYNRPNEKWECGWAHRGFRCHVGPTPSGSCSKKGECEPIKKDDGYHCTRLPQYGGKCHQGPMPNGKCSKQFPPCSPKRTLRAKRGLTTIALTILSLGIIFFQLGTVGPGTAFFSPGALSFQHSSMMNNCTTCHSEAHNSPLNWILTAGAGHQNANNCLDCHKMGEHPFKAHSLPPSQLAEVTKALMGGEGEPASPKEFRCTACHKEHRGSDFDLTAMTKRQCQTCHTQKFDGLDEGHPEFSNYPFSKRVRILFDHTEHFNKHFPKKEVGEDISCNTCHAPSSIGGKMVLNGFETSCASCHKDQIYGDNALNKGVVFFRMPTLDIDTLAAKGKKIGGWPEDADGKITPFTKILLAGNETAIQALNHIEENEIELDDLSDASRETLNHVEKLAWAMKSLLNDLRSGGVTQLQERLESSYGKPVDRDQLVAISGSLPLDVVRGATRTWFRSFDREMESFSQGRLSSTVKLPAPESDDEDEDQMTAGGWYTNNSEFAIKYRPTGHSDRFLQGWLNLSSQTVEQLPAAKAVFEELANRSESPGACTKCHGVEKSQNELKVNWMGPIEKIGSQGFVRFSHSSHLNLLKQEGCYTCHELNKDAQFSKAYEGYDATVFESNFHSLKKAACIRCHQEGQVKDTCTTCHNYHIGDFFSSEEQMKRIHTQLNEEEEKKEDEAAE